MHQHSFKAHLSWQKHPQAGDINLRRQLKNHTVQIEGKETLHLSAAKAFKGDSNLLNPEDLLLSSLMSCHMLSYLYVCGQHQIEVVNYEDSAEAFLEVYEDGSGKIVKVILNPIVGLKDASQAEIAMSLHGEARKLCFIANSCNFEMVHQPKVVIA